ncbi:MAG: trigger factor, partial [Oscillospiraceae bacterium]|nr:trigger factor [Oscillospiraceae bacterium]
IADLENLEVTAEDIENEYNKLAEEYKMEVDKVKSAIPESTLKSDIKIEKAIDFVKDNAKIEEITE